MTDASIPCSCCKGTGRKTLAKENLDTLKTLKKMGRASCGDVALRMQTLGLLDDSLSQTVIHKRFARMEKLGLVRRIKTPGRSTFTSYTANVYEAV